MARSAGKRGRLAAWLGAILALAVSAVGASCTSSTVSCPAGQTSCGGSCVDLQADPLHCGACGDACISGATCVAGVCACLPPTSSCGLGCVNKQSDVGNCGACGHRCGIGSCAAGLCVCDATQGNVKLCPDDPATGTCVNVDSSVANCGDCGIVCAARESCVQGLCACVSPNQLCSTGSTTPVCTDVTSDPANCGACGRTCPSGTRCTGGTCGTICQAGYTLCGGTCVDLKTDPVNCGRCGAICATGQTCAQGTCSTCSAVCSGTCCGGGTACCDVAGGSPICQANHADFPGTSREVTWNDCTPAYTYDRVTAQTAGSKWRPDGLAVSTTWSCTAGGTQSACVLWQYAPLTAQAECGVFCYTGNLQGAAAVSQGYLCSCPTQAGTDWY